MTTEELETLDDLALMRRRFKLAEESDTLNRVSMLEKIAFYYGNQWADAIERARKADGRPCWTVNRLPAILKQVNNEMRANPPAIEMQPEGLGTNDDDAEARQGLARHVEQHSEAKVAYENAFEYMLIGGFASWRVEHDYLPKSFDQELYIKPIWNPLAVLWDPSAQEVDKSDAKYCFVIIDLSVEAHHDAYPKSELAGLKSFDGNYAMMAPGWLHRDGARVVEYYTIEEDDATLVKLDDGTDCYDDEIPEGARIAVDESGEPISRPDKRRKAYVAHSNGVEWLKKRKALPVDEIPIVTIYGDRLLVDGETRYKGMVDDLIDPQRMFNYNTSAISETMALGSKANWTATVEQIEPFMSLWQQSSSRNFSVLPYHHVPGVERPQKISSEPPIAAMSAARQQSADDLRSVSGVYDQTQVSDVGEESGAAILARRHQASQGNVNYIGNLARGVRRTGQLLLKFFPKIYDRARLFHVLGIDQQPKDIVVHSGRPDTVPAMLPDKIGGVFDLSTGSFNVAVNVGRSYDTMNQETVDMLLRLIAANPALATVIGDQVVDRMNFPGKRAIVERLRRALPPALQDQDSNSDPAQMQAHNGILMQQNQKLMAQIQAMSQLIQTKQIEGQSRERVERMKLQATQILAAARTDQERIKAGSAILLRQADKHFEAVHDHSLATRDAVHGIIEREHTARLRPPALPAAPGAPGESVQ